MSLRTNIEQVVLRELRNKYLFQRVKVGSGTYDVPELNAKGQHEVVGVDFSFYEDAESMIPTYRITLTVETLKGRKQRHIHIFDFDFL